MAGLSFIGIGLHGERNISLSAIEEAKGCEVLYAEFYTSPQEDSLVENLQKTIGKKVVVLSRKEVEEDDVVLEKARNHKVGFFVPGDAMIATTHIELRVRAEKEGIRTNLIHGTSIFSAAAGLLGLQPYKFGRSTTIPFKSKGYEPTSPYDVIKVNKDLGFHTLVLLDINVDETRTLRTDEALDYLIGIERKEGGGVASDQTLVCVIADAGSHKSIRKSRLHKESD